MTREERKHAIKCLEYECEDTDYSIGCKRKCKTDGADCYIKTAIKSIQAWEEILAELEIELNSANNTYNKYNNKVDLGRVFGIERAIDIIKQKLEQ